MRHLIAALTGAFLWAGPLAAQDHPLAAALEVSQEGDWSAGQAVIAGEDAVLRDVFTWMRLRAGEAEFDEYPAFLSMRADWPGLGRARARAEEAITPETPVSDVLAFFDGADIETGQGAVAYADALIEDGQRDAAEAMLVDIWLTLNLTEDGFDALIAAYPEILGPYHADRADMLLWKWRTTDAAYLLPYLEEGERAYVRARIGYIEKADDISARLALVPDRLRDSPALTYDRFNWLADRGDWTDAVALLRRQESAQDLVHPWRWASWRRVLARWQMREGRPRVAYRLASQHFLTEGSSYADLEWLSGYIALTYFEDAALALSHFDRFRAAVSSPISLGRAGYWIGRAHQAQGHDDAARASFADAAAYQTSFYGLLAAEELAQPLDTALIGEGLPDWRAAPFLQQDRMQAALHLLEAGERGLAVLFIVDLAKELGRAELAQLGAMFLAMEEEFFAILVAKTAVRRDIVIQDIYFPIHRLAEMDLPVEPALALAIARQESEFRIDAGSAVGALGLMQLMPGTAQDMAEEEELAYSRGRLTSDWQYNARLGSAYLEYLQDMFGDSPVLISVGYNAGPGRVRSWLRDRGDPRRDSMDVVDWIEHIPFRETRNYVMRVTEGLAVYRARLSGQTGPVRFEALLRGKPPIIRPRLRPDGLGETELLRPVARPSDG